MEKIRDRAPDSRGVLVELARQVVSRGRSLIRKAGSPKISETPESIPEGNGGDELTDTRTQMADTDQHLRTPG